MLKPAVAATSMIKNIFQKKEVPVGAASPDQVASLQSSGSEALVQQARQERINFRRDISAVFSLLQPLYSECTVTSVGAITYNVGQSAPTRHDVEKIYQLMDRAPSPDEKNHPFQKPCSPTTSDTTQTMDDSAAAFASFTRRAGVPPLNLPTPNDADADTPSAPPSNLHSPVISPRASDQRRSAQDASPSSIPSGSPRLGGGAASAGGYSGVVHTGAVSKEVRGPDIYAIALQEVDMSTAAVVVSLATTDRRVDDKMSGKAAEWASALTEAACRRGSYRRIATKGMCGLLLVVLVRTSMLPYMKELSIDTVKLGKGGLVGNKAAIGVRFVVHGRAFVFVGSHLAPHREGFDRRNKQYHTILREMSLRPKHTSDELWRSLPSSSLWLGGTSLVEDSAVSMSPSVARGAGDRHCVEEDIRAEVCGSAATAQMETAMRDLPDILACADYVWWMGDLNYRVWRADAHENINRAREGKLAKSQADEERKISGSGGRSKAKPKDVDLMALAHGDDDGDSGATERMTPFDQVVASLVEMGDFASLQLLDQLTQTRRLKLAFELFTEPPVLFPPTYKYLPGDDVYEPKKWRTPSYCDRTLYWVRPTPPLPRLPDGLNQDLQRLLAAACEPHVQRELRCTLYTSAHTVRLSDHRPVVGYYEVATTAVDYERAVHVACEVAEGVYRVAGAQYAAAVEEDRTRLRQLLPQLGNLAGYKDEVKFQLRVAHYAA